MRQSNYQGALQQPIGSGFTAASTAQQVIKGISLAGKTAIVTGGHAGIGLETTKVLAAAGARVVVPARDTEKARRTLQGLANVELETLDLMEPDSIAAFATKFLASGRPLHLLINNAGIMWVPLRRTQSGIESQLATNYLGAFALVARLWPALKQANGARVVNVSSFGHQLAPFHFEDPNFERRPYHTLQGYGQSKTATNLFTVELDQRGQACQVRAYAVHPGSINGTELGREAPLELLQQLGLCDAQGQVQPEVASQLKTIPQGAATTVWCATSPQLATLGGVYCEDVDVAELDEGQIEHLSADISTARGVQPYSLAEAAAKQLWTLSEQMTGIAFPLTCP